MRHACLEFKTHTKALPVKGNLAQSEGVSSHVLLQAVALLNAPRRGRYSSDGLHPGKQQSLNFFGSKHRIARFALLVNE
jgi:hypothetical protein